jgi:hypothetical protein
MQTLSNTDIYQETGPRDSVFTTVGLAMLKSSLKLSALLLVAISANAQTSRGTVTGTVLDPTGAVITGARVTLTGVETAVRLSTNSNDAGVYRFDAVDLGTYDLAVLFQDFVSISVLVSVWRRAARDNQRRREMCSAHQRGIS